MMERIARRKFIRQAGLLAGALLAGNMLELHATDRASGKIRGRVSAGGEGLKDVVVSDGYSVVRTNRRGRYKIDLHPDATLVFVSTPSGHAFIEQAGIARHYANFGDAPGKEYDFELQALDRSDLQHEFVIWADPQVKNAADVKKMMEQSVPDVKKFVAGRAAGTLIHGITVGDIVWDEHALFADYDRAVEQMGIPFFQCLGNHDMDYRKGGDETSDLTFKKTYGPTYYSFNRGQVHYVVMDNVRYLGKEREYDGFFQQHQLDWLRKDLAEVPADNLVILCAHIPVGTGTKNKEALYEVLRTRKVHIMSGHTHFHANDVRGNIFEHNHGTVCGAWWTGDICCDGTPSGYGVYQVNGNELRWQYLATGQPAEYQFRIHEPELQGEARLVKVNIWNHDPAWTTNVSVDGVEQGPLQQKDDFDPVAYARFLGPALPKPRGFVEPWLSDHLFHVRVPVSARELTITVTDRFGQRYTQKKMLG